MEPNRKIFSGIQPSGIVHVGNYIGAIRNWASLLDDYECIFCIVDYHAITQPYDLKEMDQRIFDAAVANIAAGLDPRRCKLFVQSDIPEHTELAWIFNCVTPIGELQRMTQFKDKSQQFSGAVNVGLLDYPILQAADILLYKAGWVPVGEDQVQHVEFTREVARKFNNLYGETFPEAQVLLAPQSRVMGLDGKSKMSKSMNNYVGLLEPEETIREKLRVAVTDPARVRRHDPGNPDICAIYHLHRAFSPSETVQMVNRDCRTAGIGCVECKKLLADTMLEHLAPIRAYAEELTRKPDVVHDVLATSARACKETAEAVMDEVRTKIGVRGALSRKRRHMGA